MKVPRKKVRVTHNQAGAIPFRFGLCGFQVCLITSRRSGRWQFPKGWIECDQSPEEAALAESFQEAGVHGKIIGPPVGTLRNLKRSKTLSVVYFPLLVSQAANRWKECEQRERQWCSIDEARTLIERRALRRALELTYARYQDTIHDPFQAMMEV